MVCNCFLICLQDSFLNTLNICFQTSIYHLRLKKGNSHHSIWCISICHFIWFLYHFSSPCSYMNLNFSSCWLVFVGCNHLTWLSLCLECLPYLYVKNTIFFYFLNLAFRNHWKHLFVARNIFKRCVEPDLSIMLAFWRFFSPEFLRLLMHY